MTIRTGAPIGRFATLPGSGVEGEKETIERDEGKNQSSDDEEHFGNVLILIFDRIPGIVNRIRYPNPLNLDHNCVVAVYCNL